MQASKTLAQAALAALGLALLSCAPRGTPVDDPASVSSRKDGLGCAESQASAAGAAFAASGSAGTQTPDQAFDGNPATVWNAGGPPPQWIQAELPATVPVTRLRLAVEQSPQGPTRHVVSAATPGIAARDVAVAAGDTQSGQWLDVPVFHRARTLRVTTDTSPSWVAWREVEIHQDPTIAPRYFGYYCSGCSWVGSGNYTAATADHANLVWIADAPVDRVIARVVEAAGHGMKSVVSVTSVFFSGAALAPGYEAAWDAFATALEPYAADLAAFYPVDEPDLQGFTDAPLATAAAAIRARFPAVPVAVIYSPLTVASGNRPGISSYDWVAIDCYSQGAYQCSGVPYEDAYYALRAALDPSRQRTFLVPQAGLPIGYPDSTADALAPELDAYLALARRDLLVVAVVPFLYQTFDDGMTQWKGLEAFPTLRAKFAQAGLALQAEYAAATSACQPPPPDAGVAGPDAAAPGRDAGSPGRDAAVARRDAATAGEDAGETVEDSGTSAGDGGAQVGDGGGTGVGDSGTDAGGIRPGADGSCGCGPSGAGAPSTVLNTIVMLGLQGVRRPRRAQ